MPRSAHPAARLRDNVVDSSCRRHAPGLQAGLTQAAVATQDALPDLVPRGSVSPRMAIAAHRVRLPIGDLLRMHCAVRHATRDECVAAAMLAWPHSASRHRFMSHHRIKENARKVLTLRASCEILRVIGITRRQVDVCDLRGRTIPRKSQPSFAKTRANRKRAQNTTQQNDTFRL